MHMLRQLEVFSEAHVHMHALCAASSCFLELVLCWQATDMLQRMRRTWWAWPAMSWRRSSRCDLHLRRRRTWRGTCRIGLRTGVIAIVATAAGLGERTPELSPFVKHVDRNVSINCVSRPDLHMFRGCVSGRASGRWAGR